jgi:predicted sulfurtransferase
MSGQARYGQPALPWLQTFTVATSNHNEKCHVHRVSAFDKFVAIEGASVLRACLLATMAARELKGTIRRAVDPGTHRLGQFPPYTGANLDTVKHKQIARFCTGGIRCGKASAYLLSLGSPEV